MTPLIGTTPPPPEVLLLPAATGRLGVLVLLLLATAGVGGLEMNMSLLKPIAFARLETILGVNSGGSFPV